MSVFEMGMEGFIPKLQLTQEYMVTYQRYPWIECVHNEAGPWIYLFQSHNSHRQTWRGVYKMSVSEMGMEICIPNLQLAHEYM